LKYLGWMPLLLALMGGCATPSGTAQDRLNSQYGEKIRDWQRRIQREGWSENQVGRILVECRSLVTYRMEIRDHWDTPREFMARGFAGDCEDIVFFMMGTLRRLGYPRGVRVLVVPGLADDHALLKVEMPEGGWRLYDVASERVRAGEIRTARPIVEFDEKIVIWHGVGRVNERIAESGRRN